MIIFLQFKKYCYNNKPQKQHLVYMVRKTETKRNLFDFYLICVYRSKNVGLNMACDLPQNELSIKNRCCLWEKQKKLNEELGGEKHDPKKSPNFLDALASCLSFRVVTCNNPLKQQSLFLFCYGLQKLEQTDVVKNTNFVKQAVTSSVASKETFCSKGIFLALSKLWAIQYLGVAF